MRNSYHSFCMLNSKEEIHDTLDIKYAHRFQVQSQNKLICLTIKTFLQCCNKTPAQFIFYSHCPMLPPKAMAPDQRHTQFLAPVSLSKADGKTTGIIPEQKRIYDK